LYRSVILADNKEAENFDVNGTPGSHFQMIPNLYFTGKTLKDRVTLEGYTANANEVSTSGSRKSGAEFIHQMIASVYHRSGVLDFQWDEAGFGVIPLLGNVHERVRGRAPVGGSLVGNSLVNSLAGSFSFSGSLGSSFLSSDPSLAGNFSFSGSLASDFFSSGLSWSCDLSLAGSFRFSGIAAARQRCATAVQRQHILRHLRHLQYQQCQQHLDMQCRILQLPVTAPAPQWTWCSMRQSQKKKK
jgi:hypothetical protein